MSRSLALTTGNGADVGLDRVEFMEFLRCLPEATPLPVTLESVTCLAILGLGGPHDRRDYLEVPSNRAGS